MSRPKRAIAKMGPEARPPESKSKDLAMLLSMAQPSQIRGMLLSRNLWFAALMIRNCKKSLSRFRVRGSPTQEEHPRPITMSW